MSDSQHEPETQALAVIEAKAIAVHRPPEEVLNEAISASKALARVLDQKKDPVVMNGERYLEADDWQVVARFYGLTTKIVDVKFVVYEIPGQNPIFGFDAVAALLRPDGREIGRAEASCLSDEEKWGARPKYVKRYAKVAETYRGEDGKTHTTIDRKTQKPIVKEWYPENYEPDRSEPKVWVPKKNGSGSIPYFERVLKGTEHVPLFQIKSMAQTRAAAKVCRQVLSFVPVLAGLRPTPAEEMLDYNRPPVDVTTGEIIDDRPHVTDEQIAREQDRGRSTTQRADRKAEQKPQTSAPPAKQEPAKKAKPDKRTPEQRREDEQGFGGELPTGDAAADAPNAVVVTDVEEAKTPKGPIWKVTYSDMDDREHVAITDDQEIAALASEAQRDKTLCKIDVTQGRLKYPEIDEITVL